MKQRDSCLILRRLNTRQHSQKARLERCRRITNTIPEPLGGLSQREHHSARYNMSNQTGQTKSECQRVSRRYASPNSISSVNVLCVQGTNGTWAQPTQLGHLPALVNYQVQKLEIRGCH